jgi:hypothetical protein
MPQSLQRRAQFAEFPAGMELAACQHITFFNHWSPSSLLPHFSLCCLNHKSPARQNKVQGRVMSLVLTWAQQWAFQMSYCFAHGPVERDKRTIIGT